MILRVKHAQCNCDCNWFDHEIGNSGSTPAVLIQRHYAQDDKIVLLLLLLLMMMMMMHVEALVGC